MSIEVISDMLSSTIRIATPLMLMALGGLLCQRAGVFNIGLEGFSLMGAFAGIAFVQVSGGSVIVGFLGAIIVSMLFSGIFAIFVTKFNADNIIASIAINLLAVGLTSTLLRILFDVQGRLAPMTINKLPAIDIPVIQDIPILSVLSGHTIITYFTIAMVVVVYVFLFKTEQGLAVCAVGESEEAAKTAGIKPNVIKTKVVLFSGAMCGIAGAYLSTVIVSQFTEDMVQGRGFNAFTALVFGNAHPVWSSLVTLLFGLADAVGIRIELMAMDISPSIIKMFPFVLAVVTLGISSYSSKLRIKNMGRLSVRKEKKNDR